MSGCWASASGCWWTPRSPSRRSPRPNRSRDAGETESGRQLHRAVVAKWEEGVPGDLPQVPVEVGEVPVVPAPEHVMRGRDDPPTGRFGGGEHRCNLGLLPDVVGDGHAPEAVTVGRHTRVVGQWLPAEQTEDRPTRR